MRQIYPDLWQTSTEHPVPATPSGVANAYVLVRDQGNVLFYSTGREAIDAVDDADDLRHIQELGGITHQCLAHWHEAAPALARIKQRFGATLCCHERDAEVVHSKGGIPVDRTFQARETLWGDIEVIPTPGHTPGSTCFLFESSHGGTYLFTGDTIFPSRDSWAAFAFENGSKAKLAESLELLRRLEPDVVIAAGALDTTTCKEMSPSEWQSGVDAALRSLS